VSRAVDRVRAETKSLLVAGEVEQATMLAAAAPGMNDHAVIATNKRLIVVELTMTGRLKRHVRDEDRNKPLGPYEGLAWSKVESFTEPLWISWAFKSQIIQADSFLPEELRPPSKKPESKNKKARAAKRLKRAEELVEWLTSEGGEFGLLFYVAGFVFIQPLKMLRLIQIAFRTSGGRHYGKAVAALAINIGWWLLALGVGYLIVRIILWSASWS